MPFDWPTIEQRLRREVHEPLQATGDMSRAHRNLDHIMKEVILDLSCERRIEGRAKDLLILFGRALTFDPILKGVLGDEGREDVDTTNPYEVQDDGVMDLRVQTRPVRARRDRDRAAPSPDREDVPTTRGRGDPAVVAQGDIERILDTHPGLRETYDTAQYAFGLIDRDPEPEPEGDYDARRG